MDAPPEHRHHLEAAEWAMHIQAAVVDDQGGWPADRRSLVWRLAEVVAANALALLVWAVMLGAMWLVVRG